MATATEYTLVFEVDTNLEWTGYVPQLPELAKVRGPLLNEGKYHLAGLLIDMVWAMPYEMDLLSFSGQRVSRKLLFWVQRTVSKNGWSAETDTKTNLVLLRYCFSVNL
jgi:hypothetical protein